jgi:hypothetical protein
MLPGGPWPAEGPALVLPALSVLPSAPRSAITGVITPSIALRRARRPGRYDRRLTWLAGSLWMTARTISKDMPDFPDTVRLTQEAPGMVGDTIEGTHAGVRHTRRRHAATLAALIAASAMVAGCTTSTAGPGVTTTATSGSSTATTTTTATATCHPKRNDRANRGVSGRRSRGGAGEHPRRRQRLRQALLRPSQQGLHHPPSWASSPRFRRPHCKSRAQRTRAPQPETSSQTVSTLRPGLPSRSYGGGHR